jgi:hypothetical protein
MLFNYGQKIYNKIKGHMFPSDEDRSDPDFVEFVPFDLYEGADFKLKVTMQGEMPNYDSSAFSVQKPVGDDKKIEKVMKSTHNISEFITEDKFPTNAELLKTIGSVIGVASADDEPSAKKEKPAPKPEKKEKPAPVKEEVEETEDEDTPFEGSTAEVTNDDGNDDLEEDDAFFKSLK